MGQTLFLLQPIVDCKFTLGTRLTQQQECASSPTVFGRSERSKCLISVPLMVGWQMVVHHYTSNSTDSTLRVYILRCSEVEETHIDRFQPRQAATDPFV